MRGRRIVGRRRQECSSGRRVESSWSSCCFFDFGRSDSFIRCGWDRDERRVIFVSAVFTHSIIRGFNGHIGILIRRNASGTGKKPGVVATNAVMSFLFAYTTERWQITISGLVADISQMKQILFGHALLKCPGRLHFQQVGICEVYLI